MDSGRPAKGVKGYLLTSTEGIVLFRVFQNDTKQKTFKDYKIKQCDLEMEILDELAVLYDAPEDNIDGFINYPSQIAKGIA